jgi:hypothetical protein
MTVNGNLSNHQSHPGDWPLPYPVHLARFDDFAFFARFVAVDASGFTRASSAPRSVSGDGFLPAHASALFSLLL